MTAEQRPGGGGRVSQAAIQRRAFQAENKGLKVRACLMGSQNSKEASVSEKCWGQVSSRGSHEDLAFYPVRQKPLEGFG